MADDKTQEQIDLEEKKTIDLSALSPEQREEIFKLHFGVGSDGLIKKEDQVKVLTEAEKLELEQKEEEEVLQYSLTNKVFNKNEYEDYVTASQTGSIDLLRKKYVTDHPDDKEAGKTFDRIFHLDEADELVDGEITTPNLAKQKAIALLDKQAEDYKNGRFSKITNAKTSYQNHKEEQAIIKTNTTLVAKAIAEVPREIKIDTGYGEAAFKYSDEDIQAANQMIIDNGLLKNKEVKPDEIKDTVNYFLRGLRAKDITDEAVRVAVANTVDEMERGKLGIDIKKVHQSDGVTKAKEDFVKSLNIPLKV